MRARLFIRLSLLIILLLSVLITYGQNYPDYRPDIYINPESHYDPNVQLLIQKARSLSEIGIYQSAILTYQEVIRLDPANEPARLELGEIALKIKNWAYAIKVFNEITYLNPNDVKTRLLLMEIYHSFQLYTQELKMVYELVNILPGDTELLKRLVFLYGNQEMYTDQIWALKRLINLEPSEPKYLWQLAGLYYNLQKESKEFSTYKKLQQIEPDNITLIKRLARRYGETDNYSRQIKYYKKIQLLQSSDSIWNKQLITSYNKALRNYDFRFSLKAAYKDCFLYLENSENDKNVIQTSKALKWAARPMINLKTTYQQYNIPGVTNHWENIISVGFIGPITGSFISIQNSHIFVRSDYSSIELNDNQTDATRESQVYVGKIIWQQKLSNLEFSFVAGAMSPISNSPVNDLHFISSTNLSYSLSQDFSVSVSHNLINLTVSPLAIENQIHINQLESDISYTILRKFHINTSYTQQYFSDNNISSNALVNLEFDIIKTFFRVKDIETELPLGFDGTGTNFTLGLEYNFLNFINESMSYLTIKKEHSVNASILFEKQLWQSFIFRIRGFKGINPSSSKIWGYNLALEKHLNWRLNLFIEYENFLSPYSYEGEKHINHENRLQLGIVSRF